MKRILNLDVRGLTHALQEKTVTFTIAATGRVLCGNNYISKLLLIKCVAIYQVYQDARNLFCFPCFSNFKHNLTGLPG